jgi:4-hydroxy-3-methylbut-2-en-1-yl diphosphate reductase
LARFDSPVFVRHQIVHNPFVVAELARKGAVFIDGLDAVPDGGIVVFSAHGVAKSVRQEAERRHLTYIDATCPLVTKVHREVEHHVSAGRKVILIGHQGHPEVTGTMGQAPSRMVLLVQSAAEAAELPIDETASYGVVSQTTLSTGDVEEITAILRDRVRQLYEPSKADICYATTNRQAAIAAIAPRCDAVVVVGGLKSSDSGRLVEIAIKAGCQRATLVESAVQLDPSFLDNVRTLGITSGASTPEPLVQELLKKLATQFEVRIEEFVTAVEETRFRLPHLT